MMRQFVTRSLGLLALLVLFSNCNKEKPTKAIVHIKDVNGSFVPGAYVKLYANIANPQGDLSRLKQEVMSDGSGDATFDYTGFYKQGQAGFAVLDIVSFKDSAVGEGIIKIVEQETSEETVVLKHI